MEIRKDDLSGAAVQVLLREHLEHMRAVTPPGSVYALEVDGLRAPDVTFWCAWEGEALLGCAALKELDSRTGEIKSMRTARAHARRGVGSALLEHLLRVARSRAYDHVHLETGASEAFAAARAFYRRHGFVERGAFGDYRDDPHSYYMTKRIEPAVSPDSGRGASDSD